MTLMGRDFDAYEQAGRLVVQMEDRLLDLPPPSLFGAHQFANAGLAVAAILAFGDPRIDEDGDRPRRRRARSGRAASSR